MFSILIGRTNNFINDRKEGLGLVTYDDIAYFYKDKENIVNYDPQRDDCQKLAETFFMVVEIQMIIYILLK